LFLYHRTAVRWEDFHWYQEDSKARRWRSRWINWSSRSSNATKSSFSIASNRAGWRGNAHVS
jgi:hypothetical protein